MELLEAYIQRCCALQSLEQLHYTEVFKNLSQQHGQSFTSTPLSTHSLQNPPILVLFITSVWFIFIIWCTVVIDLWHHEPFQQVVIHSIGLACICVILYLIFTITVQSYVGFPLLLTYWIYAILRYRNQHYITLYCGNCGAEIPQLGICPYCGAINKQLLTLDNIIE